MEKSLSRSSHFCYRKLGAEENCIILEKEMRLINGLMVKLKVHWIGWKQIRLDENDWKKRNRVNCLLIVTVCGDDSEIMSLWKNMKICSFSRRFFYQESQAFVSDHATKNSNLITIINLCDASFKNAQDFFLFLKPLIGLRKPRNRSKIFMSF